MFVIGFVEMLICVIFDGVIGLLCFKVDGFLWNDVMFGFCNDWCFNDEVFVVFVLYICLSWGNELLFVDVEIVNWVCKSIVECFELW